MIVEKSCCRRWCAVLLLVLGCLGLPHCVKVLGNKARPQQGGVMLFCYNCKAQCNFQFRAGDWRINKLRKRVPHRVAARYVVIVRNVTAGRGEDDDGLRIDPAVPRTQGQDVG